MWTVTLSTFPLPRDRFIVTDISAPRKHSSTGDLLSIELQQVACSCNFIFSPRDQLYIDLGFLLGSWALQGEDTECLALMHSLLLCPACIPSSLLRAAACLAFHLSLLLSLFFPAGQKQLIATSKRGECSGHTAEMELFRWRQSPHLKPFKQRDWSEEWRGKQAESWWAVDFL